MAVFNRLQNKKIGAVVVFVGIKIIEKLYFFLCEYFYNLYYYYYFMLIYFIIELYKNDLSIF